MRSFQLFLAAALVFVTAGAGLSKEALKTGADLRYSMLRSGIDRSQLPNPVIKAACTGANTCCCRAGSQLFCTTPDACSKMGGACSAGCY